MILVFRFFLLLFFRFCCFLDWFILSGCACITATFSRLLTLFLRLISCLRTYLLWRSMAPNIRNSLQFPLFRHIFSLLLLLLDLITFSSGFKLVLIDDKEMARAPLWKIRLSQDVLYASYWRNLAFVVYILQLVHFIRLVDNSISLFKVNQLVLCFLRCCCSRCRTEWMSLSGSRSWVFCLCCALLRSVSCLAHLSLR